MPFNKTLLWVSVCYIIALTAFSFHWKSSTQYGTSVSFWGSVLRKEEFEVASDRPPSLIEAHDVLTIPVKEQGSLFPESVDKPRKSHLSIFIHEPLKFSGPRVLLDDVSEPVEKIDPPIPVDVKLRLPESS